MSGLIGIVARIVKTIAKHITAEDTLAGGGVGVCVDESTDGRIVISGLEIIEPGLYFLSRAKSLFLTTFPAVFSQANPLLNYTKNYAKSQHNLTHKLENCHPN